MNTVLTTIPDPLLSDLGDFLAGKIGIHFAKERWHDLERGIDATARELGFKDVQSCAQWFLSTSSTKAELEVLVSHFTVGETYFFREPKSFEAIETCIIPELIRARRGKDQYLRIWSAGCATGEEPYSVAILLHKLIPDLDDWNITILATDINPRFLQKAAQGIYTEWSFRGVPAWIRERYFKTIKKDHYQIVPQIRRMVKFSYLNLAEDVYPALMNGTNAMDLILCRNVLMYFRQSYAQRVIENLHRSLVEGGWLIVSPVETSHILFSSFAAISLHGMTLYSKSEKLARDMADFEPGFEPAILKAETAEFKPFTYEPGSAITPLDEIIPPLTETVEQRASMSPEPDWYNETLALYQGGHYAEAATRVAGILSEIPDDTQAIELLARALANQGRLAEAAEWCEKAIGGDRLNAGCHYLSAMIEQERGRFNEAITSLKRTLYLDPDFVLAYFSLGNLARLQGKTKETEKHFANALSLLNALRPEDILPQSEGMTAGRLMEIIQSMTFRRTAA